MQCTGATRCQIEKREQCNQMVKVEGIIYQSRKADFPFNETHTRLLNCNVLNPSPIINPLLFLAQWAENISDIWTKYLYLPLISWEIHYDHKILKGFLNFVPSSLKLRKFAVTKYRGQCITVWCLLLLVFFLN